MTKVTLESRIVHAPRCTLRQLEAALSAGWATDPDYAHKLVTVANRIAAR
jgi:flagellum-specific peptidoglycan hydrolase FlgJ